MEPKHTVFAGKAVGLAQLFRVMIGKLRLEGPVTYVPELSAPDGPSTGSGLQALQHILELIQSTGDARLLGQHPTGR